MLHTCIRGVLISVVFLTVGCRADEAPPPVSAPSATSQQVVEPVAERPAVAEGTDRNQQPGQQPVTPAAAIPDIVLEPRDRDPMELVQQINDTSVEVLAELPFHELNLLKNAVYAAKGYKFAEDKPWLRKFFCDGYFPEGDFLNNEYSEEETARAFNQKKLQLREWRGQLPPPGRFDLSRYAFPGCEENGEITEAQKLAAANIRIATIKKLERFKGNLEAEIARITIPESDHVYYLLGRLFPSAEADYVMDGAGYYNYTDYLDTWKMSLKRELMGLNQLVKLMKRLEDFDQMELLGLYAGDIALLKNIVEAKYGRPFQGVTGWEVSQLVGVTDVNPEYDAAKLPVKVQVRIQVLEETIKKILRSDLNDLPKGLRDGAIKIENWYPAAC